MGYAGENVHDTPPSTMVFPKPSARLTTPSSGRAGAAGIEIVGAGHSRDIRIKTVAVPQTDDLLEDDRHLLFARITARRLDVVAGFAKVSGSVDKLDGLNQLPETGVRIELIVRNHLGAVDTRERPVQRIFQQAGRADRQRGLHLHDQSTEVTQQFHRKIGLLKSMPDMIVGKFVNFQLGKMVLRDEFVEAGGRQDGHGGNIDFDARQCGEIDFPGD